MGTLGFDAGLTYDFTSVTYPESLCPYLFKLGIMKLLPSKFLFVKMRHNIYVKCVAHSRYLISDSNFDDNWVNII